MKTIKVLLVLNLLLTLGVGVSSVLVSLSADQTARSLVLDENQRRVEQLNDIAFMLRRDLGAIREYTDAALRVEGLATPCLAMNAHDAQRFNLEVIRDRSR